MPFSIQDFSNYIQKWVDTSPQHIEEIARTSTLQCYQDGIIVKKFTKRIKNPYQKFIEAVAFLNEKTDTDPKGIFENKVVRFLYYMSREHFLRFGGAQSQYSINTTSLLDAFDNSVRTLPIDVTRLIASFLPHKVSKKLYSRNYGFARACVENHKDPLPVVTSILKSAGAVFKKLVSGVPIKSLDFSKVRSLALEYWQFSEVCYSCTQLETLNITDSKKIKNIPEKASIKYLDISGTHISDLSELKSWPNIETMNGYNLKRLKTLPTDLPVTEFACTQTNIEDLSPITSWKKLQSLTFSSQKYIEAFPLNLNIGVLKLDETLLQDAAFLTSWKLLKEIHLHGSQILNDGLPDGLTVEKLVLNEVLIHEIDSLSTWPKLKELTIINCPNLIRLPENTTVEKLTISELNTEDDIDPINTWSKLTELNISKCPIQGLHVDLPVKKLTLSKIKSLENEDLLALPSWTKLSELTINQCFKIKKLPPKLTVETLNLSNLFISNVSSLNSWPQLTKITVDRCPQITLPKELESITQPKTL